MDLGYVLSYGEAGAAHFARGIAWKTWMDEPLEFLLADGEVAIKVKDVEAAESKGHWAVAELISSATSATIAHPLVLDPDFREALEEVASRQFSWGEGNAMRP